MTRLLSALLDGVKRTAPLTLAVVAVVLTGVARSACWLPVRRAVRFDLIMGLRFE